MNLCEARKLGHEGWVRSPTRTNNEWLDSTAIESWCRGDLDTEDWEPKPAPVQPFEGEVWVDKNGAVAPVYQGNKDADQYGWRKIRVREVTE